jgi:ferrous iron transport protein B
MAFSGPEPDVARSRKFLRDSAPRRLTVALVGNPNTGKSTLFNRLAGMRQHVGNYPGVTVETKKGKLNHHDWSIEIIDLPGTYSLAARSPDEIVAVDVILGRQQGERRPDLVVSIVDASNLERNLYLTTQALELGVPVIVALNMIDIALRHGMQVDCGQLEKAIGVPVIPVQANKGIGLDRLKNAIIETAHKLLSSVNNHADPGPWSTAACAGPSFPLAFEREVAALGGALATGTPVYLARRLLLDVGGYAERILEAEGVPQINGLVAAARERLASAGHKVPEMEARTRYRWIREVTASCVRRPTQRPVTWTDRLDRVLTHNILGTLLFAGLMFLVFESIFTWARPAMDLIDQSKDALGGLVEAWLEPGPLRGLLVDGVIKGVGSVLVFLPQILILFGFIAVLEDCGYMARAAFLMDKLMSRCGLSGKSFIPMLSSVACAVPGIMATRVIENRRDRLATILVAPLMSCSARLPIYTLLIGAFLTDGFAWWIPGAVMFVLYAIGLVTAPLVALLLKKTLLRGDTPIFVMEMPVYKWPSPVTVLRRMGDSGWAFVRRAGTLIFASMVLVWALLYFPSSDEHGVSYEDRIAMLGARVNEQQEQLRTGAGSEAQLRAGIAASEQEIDSLQAAWKSRSLLGRAGRALEPMVAPLGWDWRIGMAAIASFPAREVVVGTLGIIYGTGRIEADEFRNSTEKEGDKAGRLRAALQEATYDGDSAGRRVFSVPVALSVLVFFALCCQCASTLAVIRRETNTWRWPVFTFTYMTVLAYIGAFVVYQLGSWIQM